MSEQVVPLLVLTVVWLLVGVVLSVVMGRRGHVSIGWFILGVALGPLAFLIALGAARHEADEPPSHIVSPRSTGGSVDVLVGIDGSPESRLAMERAVSLLGPQLGRLTLATVVPFDDVPAHTRRALAELDRHARLCGVPAPGEELLYGQPARALVDFACRGGYEVLAIGGRGRGLSKAVLGSTAATLSLGCPVPVLIAGDASAAVGDIAA